MRSGTSTPCRGFRKSGAFSDLTGGTTKTYLCLWSLNHCQKELQLALAHCLLPGHWPAQRQDKMLPFPDLWYWQEPCETAQKRGLFSTVWKKPQMPCACPFSPSSLSKDVCVGIAGLQPFVFCGSALTVVEFLAGKYNFTAILVQPYILFRFSAVLFGNWLSFPCPKCYFPWVTSLPIPKCSVSVFCM